MAKISVHDIRGLCDAGVFRVTVEEGNAFIEETATGKRVCLTGPAPVPAAPRPRPTERRSKTERMFGSKDTWNIPAGATVDKDQGPYRGFLLIRCEECGEVKAYCAKRETYAFRCKCGHETPLEKLRPMFVKCKCGKEFRYRTNLTDEHYTHTCLDCGSPVDLELNRRGTAYVTIGENERG